MIETLSREDTTTVEPHYLDARYDGSPRAAAHRVVVHRPGAPRPALTHAAPTQRPSSPPPSERVATLRSSTQGSLRLTRRGRLALLATAIVLLFVAFSVGRVLSNAASGPARASTHTVVVAPGDTFWSLARAAMPHTDGRVAVDRLMSMNHSDGTLQVGQTLVVPGS
ncbi:hypothetical protein acdb102_47340 [Acidothermaceae bacterium B102]|nr:hypothetical protein acdb102_47340 [Acidothermaceae bacterium B102]